jgi:hypothetical protein
MPVKDTFDVIALIGRPAAGKSEVIDYLKHADLESRIKRFHIREFEEIDDFPMLWTWFEEDDLLERMGHPRLYTDSQGYFLHQYLWDLLIERIALEYSKKIKRDPNYHDSYTSIIEFSRGKEHGGYRNAFSHLSQDLLRKLSIVYINVSWSESLRKNRKRFNPARPDSILEHGLPDEKMEKLYKEVDWEEISSKSNEFIAINGINVPYVVFENEDDVTTGRGDALGARLENTLNRLWEICQIRS